MSIQDVISPGSIPRSNHTAHTSCKSFPEGAYPIGHGILVAFGQPEVAGGMVVASENLWADGVTVAGSLNESEGIFNVTFQSPSDPIWVRTTDTVISVGAQLFSAGLGYATATVPTAATSYILGTAASGVKEMKLCDGTFVNGVLILFSSRQILQNTGAAAAKKGDNKINEVK